MIQGSDEWKQARCGLVTASRISDIIATTKSGYSTSRANYRAQLVAERLTGIVAESYTNGAMQWGTDTEPLARAAYEAETGNMVREIGFVPHPGIKLSGASPDGLIDDDGLIEIKCPITATHIDYLLADKVPDKYIPQMAWQLICTQRKWCDFVSYDPRMNEELRLFLVRFTPIPSYLEMLENEVSTFLWEVDEMVLKLNNLKSGKQQ
jgi:putative phage-type endonuclease